MEQLTYEDGMNNTDIIADGVVGVPPLLMRAYFVLLFVIVLVAMVSLWRRSISLQDDGLKLSLRGELLNNFLMLLTVYAFSWLPILFVGVLDGELETASVSEGFKGQLANSHCAIQDLMARSFCMSIVVMVAIYLRYDNDPASDGCCFGRPNMFLWGILLPVLLTEMTRFLLSRKEWLMPTHSIIHHLGPLEFSVKATAPVFCVQPINESWLRQVVGEWFLTVMMVVIVAYFCLPCFRYQGDSEDESETESDSPADESTELQMEDLIGLESQPARDSPFERITSMDSRRDVSSESSSDRRQLDSTGSSVDTRQAESVESALDPRQPDSSESEQTNACREHDSESKGLYANGAGFLEVITFIGVLWSLVNRPFMALGLYAFNDGTYSNYLDIPTHVLLIIATAVLPLELDCKLEKENVEEEKKEEEEKEEKEEGEREGVNINRVQDVTPLWKRDEEGRQLQDPKYGDVDPLWVNKEGEHRLESISNRGAIGSDSPRRESNLK